MKTLIRFRLWLVLVCAVALLVPAVDGRTKKGDKLLKEGQKAEEKQDYDNALTLYEQALETDPHEPAYMLAEQRTRARASQLHLAQGRKLLQEQKLNEAMVQFQKALLTDPSSMIALQYINQANQMLKDKEKMPEGTPILTPAEKAREEVERRINSLEGPPVLRPITNQISSLKMNNQPARVLYESVGKLAGINVLLDPQGLDTPGLGPRNFNLDLTNVTLEEALSYVALVTHTFWKPISRNAIFVTQESQPKRQEYQDEVVRVFYIQNASSPNEFTEIFNGIRTGAKLSTGIFQVASQNAFIVRGSPDTMSIVEKVVHDLDRPKAEVVVDVLVMEVSKSKITNLGAALAGQTGGLNIPISFTPRSSIALPASSTTTGTTGTTGTTTGTTANTTIPLSHIGQVNAGDFSLSLPGALVEALLTDSSTHLLQRPEVRVTDGGKASLKVGSKIPYVSGSLNSAVATPGSIPYATTQFQQVDVGVNIDLSPHVNGPDEVSMHIKVEISDVQSTETIAGVQQPIIAQKVNEADIRMRDGETSILGGLSTDSDSSSIAGIPGVANMPVLGYLFGTRTKDREKDEIVVALIPHIIRAPSINLADEGVLAGTENVVKVGRRPDASLAAPPTSNMPVIVPAAPPAQLPPLGRTLEVPPGGTPSQFAPAASLPAGQLNGQGSAGQPLQFLQPPGSGNSPGQQLIPAPAGTPQVQLYNPAQVDGTAGPQGAPDPINQPMTPEQVQQMLNNAANALQNAKPAAPQPAATPKVKPIMFLEGTLTQDSTTTTPAAQDGNSKATTSSDSKAKNPNNP